MTDGDQDDGTYTSGTTHATGSRKADPTSSHS